MRRTVLSKVGPCSIQLLPDIPIKFSLRCFFNFFFLLKQFNRVRKSEITVSSLKRIAVTISKMLTELQAIEIYRTKIEFTSKARSGTALPLRNFASESIRVGKIYGVSPRTVQNIWNRRSWGYATKQFWNCESSDMGSQRTMPSDEVKQISILHLPYLTKSSCASRVRKARSIADQDARKDLETSSLEAKLKHITR